MLVVIEGVLVLGFVYCLLAGAMALRSAWALPVLADLHPAEPARYPRLSVIIPACNESDTVEAAVRSRIAQGYPSLEIVLVNDRSTDGTAAIADRLAAEDARVRVVHITDLPQGWLGKLNALDRGALCATGDWLLFTDADVHFAPDTLRRAIAYCEERRLDFLTAIPEVRPKGLLLRAAIATFVRWIVAPADHRAVEDPRSRAAVGGGVFNLVRRSAFEKTPGFAWLRLEVADDVTFGQMMKRARARCSVVNARGMISLAFYGSIGAMARGCEKAGLAVVGRFSQARLLVFTLVILTFELSPFLAAALPLGDERLNAAGAVMSAFALASTALVARRFARFDPASLLAPIGAILLAAFFLRSGYLAWRRGGILWRGTLYPTEMLRDGMRFEPPWTGGRPRGLR